MTYLWSFSVGSGKVVLINEVTIKEKLGEFFVILTLWLLGSQKKNLRKLEKLFFFFRGSMFQDISFVLLGAAVLKKEKQLKSGGYSWCFILLEYSREKVLIFFLFFILGENKF